MPTVARAARTAEPCRWPTIESVEENLRQARQAVNTARHAAEDAMGEAAQRIRRHPLRTVCGSTGRIRRRLVCPKALLVGGAVTGAFRNREARHGHE